MKISQLSLGLLAAAASAATCDSLAGLKLQNAAVTMATEVAAGAFTPPNDGRGRAGRGGGGRGPNFATLPAFCRVAATLTPTPDSDIKLEVWMPLSGWNGRYQATGNGGWAGNIGYPALAQAILDGYAASSTDTGHTGPTAAFAIGHPEKVNDYAYRSEHEMAVQSKVIAEAFYGSKPKYSYWNGCSTGGKQGLTEAQRYPNDFDGIVAGAPANYMIHLHAAQVAMAQAVHKTPGSFIPAAKFPAIHQAVLEACDALDGVKDGVLENPNACHFDPKVIECKGAETDACLTPAQADTARAILSPVKNPKTGEEIFPGLKPGSELGWGAVASQQPIGIPLETFKYVIFQNPNWDYMTFDLATDVAKSDAIDDHRNNAIDPDLSKFFAHNGKLLLYHGWADNQITPQNTVNYYSSVLKTMGGGAKRANDVRLFMVPGMGHCGGGEGTDTFDKMAPIADWVEKGKAPDTIVARREAGGVVQRTRPLCPYPLVAKYKGSGSTDEAANFTCAAK